ncbi:MAG: O-antigen ligase family protein [Aureispira sp.]
MNAIVPPYPRQKLAFGACILLFGGLIFSKFLLSLSTILLLVLALLSPSPKGDWKRLLTSKVPWAMIGVFLLFMASSLLSDHQEQTWIRIRIALPMVALPIAFSLLPTFSKRQYQGLLAVFLGAMTIACLGVLFNYVLNRAEMLDMLKRSQAIPTPNGEHIRFSLMINIALLAGIYLLEKGYYWKQQLERWLMAGSVLFLIVALHILTVRIGLLVFYANTLLLLLILLIQRRRFKTLVFLLLLFLPMPYLAYQLVPSIQTKFNLTRYNWQLYRAGEIGEYSDTRRLLSYKIGWEVAQKSPYWGVGIADLRQEQAAIYQADYPDQPPMYPHNLFLTLLAGAGIIGLLWFLACFFFPLWYYRQQLDWFFLLIHSTIFLSFITENTLLSTIGVLLYAFFVSVSWPQYRKETREQEPS